MNNKKDHYPSSAKLWQNVRCSLSRKSFLKSQSTLSVTKWKGVYIFQIMMRQRKLKNFTRS